MSKRCAGWGLAVLLLMLIGSGSAGAAGAGGERHATGAALAAALDRIAAAPDGPPGLSVLIQRGSKSEFRRRGVADLRTGARPTPWQHYRIASMAKSFSGAVALALVDAGRLRLDDTVGELLPGLLPKARRVTLRQALGHTGGLPDYIRQPSFVRALQRHPSAYRTPRQILRYVRNVPLRFRPGSSYEYSDTDNVVVALMAEQVTGLSYERLLARYVYRPLRLRSTSLPRTLRMPRPFLHGYEVAPDQAPEDISRLINPALAWSSGGIVSTPVDVGRFFRGYIGGRLFGRSLRGLQRRALRRGSSSPPGPGANAAGLGLFRYRTSCGVVYGHTGSFPGYRLFAAASANGRRSVVFTVNAQIVPGMGSQAVSRQIRRAQRLAVCHALR